MKRKKKRNILIIITILISIITIVSFYNINLKLQEQKEIERIEKEKEIELKNKNKEEEERKQREILYKEQYEKDKKEYYETLQQELDRLSSLYGTNIGISYYDINSGTSLNVNGDKQFTAASTTKVPLNMVLADKVFKENINLDTHISYNSGYYEGGTGIIQGNIQSSYSLSDLSDYSIKYSDNIATNMLYGYLGGFYNVRNIFSDYLGHQITTNENTITPNEATSFLKILYENKENNPHYDKLIDNLKNTDFKIRMEQNLSNGIVAHKIGSYGTYVNDIGIVYSNNPFILSVYTNGISSSESIITELTDFIYNKQNTNYPELKK